MNEDPYRHMSPVDAARARAHQEDLIRTQQKRQEAARALLSASDAEAKAVKDAWGPLRDALDSRKAQAVTGGQENATKPGGGHQ